MNRLFVHGIFVAILVHLSMSALSADSKNDYLTAMDQMDRKAYGDGVKTYYKFFLKTNPVSSIPSRQKDLASAFAHFKKAARENPSDTNATLFLSLIYRIIENWQRAQAGLDEIQKRHPTSFVLQFLKGEYSLGREQIDEAVTIFQKLKTSPRASKLALLAELLLKRRGIEKNAALRRVALMRQAYRHLDLMENEKAEAMFRKVIHEFPGEKEAYRALIDLLVEANRFDDAEAVLSDFKSIAGGTAQMPVQEARLRYFQKRYQEVVVLLAPLEQREQTNDYLSFFLAESAFQTGQFEMAATLFQKLFGNDPENIGFLLRATASLEARGGQGEAVDLLKREVTRQPDQPLLRMELGCLLERMNRLDEARNEYQLLADSDSPLQPEAVEKLNGLVAKLIEEEKQRLARTFADLKKGIGSVDTSSATATIFGTTEQKDQPSANNALMETVTRQQADLTKRLESLSD